MSGLSNGYAYWLVGNGYIGGRDNPVMQKRNKKWELLFLFHIDFHHYHIFNFNFFFDLLNTIHTIHVMHFQFGSFFFFWLKNDLEEELI